MSQQLFKFLCEDANYSEWSVLDEASLKEIYHNQKTGFTEEFTNKFEKFNPVEHKLINQDVFVFLDERVTRKNEAFTTKSRTSNRT